MVIVDSNDTVEVATQIFDACINPLASTVFNLLALQVEKGLISKEEAKHVIAASVDVLSRAETSDAIREAGGDLLLRMIKAVDDL